MLDLILWLFLGQTETMRTQPIHNTPHYRYYHRGSDQDVSAPGQGGFALMGGSTDVDEAFTWMSERGGNGDFLVLRGSGSDGYQEYVDDLTESNSVGTLVLKTSEAAHDPFVLEQVRNAEAIFMAGGDQWNYVGKWKDTPLLKALNQAVLDGVPLGGTSAGLAVLGEHVFTAEHDTITSEEALADPYHEAITLDSDFLHARPLKGLITDSHFSQRDRMGRLVTFMSRLQTDRDQPTMRGLGVDERTAVLVEPEGEARVVGDGDAHFVRALEKPERCASGQPLTHSALEVHSVAPGRTFNLDVWSGPDTEPRAMRVVEGKLEILD